MQAVANCPDLAAARVTKSVLEAAGIDAEIPDEHFAGISWQMSTALHGVRVMVADDMADEARRLLSNVVREEPLDDADVDVTERCPACASTDIGPPSWKKRVKAAALVFLPALLFYAVASVWLSNRECRNCRTRWNAGRVAPREFVSRAPTE